MPAARRPTAIHSAVRSTRGSARAARRNARAPARRGPDGPNARCAPRARDRQLGSYGQPLAFPGGIPPAAFKQREGRDVWAPASERTNRFARALGRRRLENRGLATLRLERLDLAGHKVSVATVVREHLLIDLA